MPKNDVGVNNTAAFSDHWDVDITWGWDLKTERLWNAAMAAPTNTANYFFGAGGSSIHSTGTFGLTLQGGKIIVSGIVAHLWSDPGYDFNLGSDYKAETQKLEKAGYAKPFQWQATWREQIDGVLQPDASFWSDPATSKGHVWLRFENTPTS